MKKKISASSVALWILFIASLVVLVMFYCVGFGNMETISNNTYTAPENTGLLLVWLYVLVGICVGTVLIFSIVNGFKMAKGRDKSERRKSWIAPVFIGMVIVILVSYFVLADTTPVRLGDLSLYENASMLILTDTCIFTIYALVAVAILCAALSMTGIFKSRK